MKYVLILAMLLSSSCLRKNPGIIPGADFSLTNAGEVVQLKDFRNKITIIYFGYTFCPDVCPASLSYLGKVLKKFSVTEMEKVVPILISVDPGRDSPKHLAEYTKYFHPKMKGLTGTRKEIDKTISLFKSYYKINRKNKKDEDYTVDHSSVFYVIDKDGRIVNTFRDYDPINESVAYIKSLL